MIRQLGPAARVPTAKTIEYPLEQLQLAGASGRGGPPPSWALAATTAIGVALLPAAPARGNRR
jgi:hypothetical protein